MLWELDLRVALAPLVSREAAQEPGGHHSSNLTADPARGGNETCLQLDRNVSRLGRASHSGDSISCAEALVGAPAALAATPPPPPPHLPPPLPPPTPTAPPSL